MTNAWEPNELTFYLKTPRELHCLRVGISENSFQLGDQKIIVTGHRLDHISISIQYR